MEFLLLIFGVFTLSIAWRARTDAQQARKIAMDLQRELAELRVARTAPEPTKPSPAASAATAATISPATLIMPAPAPAPARPPQPPVFVPSPVASAPAPAPAAPRPPMKPIPRPVQPPPRWLLAVKAWLFGGNLVAKLGLLILFIGVSFLLKYTAARVSVPIEFRLAGIVLADIALLAWGWRIRLSRPAISLPVQGAALAVLMLVTFGAFRLYHLIPGGLAFALLFVLTVFTCVLAVLQNAMWLAIFGITGGFAAPILASSGGGSHIGLFSYYALLNAGVFALALLRSWRPLNLLGFAFTFAIGTTWGVLRYTPDNYPSVQLFLLLFFAFYVSIPLAYARQQAVKLKNYVDGTLIFGTPLLGFGLQFSLVRGFEFGAAYSALALGLFYIGLATALRRQREKYALLSDSFLALGIVFGTLAIPFALDGRWTSAAWALEGAGIVWIGLRQKQKLAWMFGLLVQAGAWISFIGTVSGLSPVTALESNLWLGFVLLAVTAFLMATRFRAQDESSAKAFTMLASVFLAFATVWLMAGAWTEIFLRTDGAMQADLLVASALLTATALYFIARRMAWSLAGALALAAQVIAGIMMLESSFSNWSISFNTENLFERPFLGALMIFAGAIFSSWALMRQQPQKGDSLFVAYRLSFVWAALWWFTQVLPDLAGWLGVQYQLRANGYHNHFEMACYAGFLLVALTTIPAVLLARRLQWPGLRWFTIPTWITLTLASLPMLTILYLDTMPGKEAWLSYIALWLAGEWLLRVWPTNDWTIRPIPLRLVHLVRTAGPWLMIWPTAAYWITQWLRGNGTEAQLLADAGWTTDASWARFIPAWLMMAAVGWLMRRSRAGGWPVAPIADWYRRRLIPLASGWAALLMAAWNLTQNGAMAPLPYIPLLNPLDLSTCFAMLMVYGCQRLLRDHPATGAARTSRLAAWPAHWVAPLPLAGALLGYLWFNLALLRTVSHYMGVPYQFEAMFASQFVQAMLSLVWSVTALVMMRYAASRTLRTVWIGGAALLALVVAKLFLVDLSNVGGVERIVSFVGVGALMVGIGYLAPYPTQTETTAEPA
jgi:uncharacterized membrane protein